MYGCAWIITNNILSKQVATRPLSTPHHIDSQSINNHFKIFQMTSKFITLNANATKELGGQDKVEDFRSGNSNRHMNILIKRAWPFLYPIYPSLHQHWAYIKYSRVPTLFGIWLFWGWFTTFKRIHEVWMPKTFQKMFDFWNFCLSEGRLPWFIWNFGISDKLFSSENKLTLWCKNCAAMCS